MHNFKKVLVATLSVVIVFTLCSIMLITPYLHSEMSYYQDGRLRASLAGEVDFLTTGASNTLCAIDSQILDQKLGVSSYNLSGALMTLGARDFFLRMEVERNPVKTVVMDISYDTMVRDEAAEYARGDSTSFARLTSFRQRMDFLRRCISFDDLGNLYAQLFMPSLEYFLGRLTGQDPCGVQDEAKGFYSQESHNVELTAEEARKGYEIKSRNTSFREENMEKLTDQIRYCQNRDIQVILVVVPRADADLWENDGHDQFLKQMQSYCRENKCSFYDMNLLKERYELWNDKRSYFDGQHMSAEGAAVFTKAFCDILRKAETEDVSQYFYPSYEAMKADSPYMAYLQ